MKVVGGKNRNTLRAKQQLHLDSLKDKIIFWYIEEKYTTIQIQKLILDLGFNYTIGQIGFAITRFGLKRNRDTKTETFLNAIKNRKYKLKNCNHCIEKFLPTSNSQLFCQNCSPCSTHSRRIKRYGVGKQEFDKMYFAQDAKCGICKLELDLMNTVVDHDHITLYIRGLLCRKCNLKLCVIEEKQFVINAQEYLSFYEKNPNENLRATLKSK